MQTYHAQLAVMTLQWSLFNSCRGHEWSTFVHHQWTSVAWYVETVSPPSECVTYYVTEAQRTIDTADADSLIACLSALTILLPKVIAALAF